MLVGYECRTMEERLSALMGEARRLRANALNLSELSEGGGENLSLEEQSDLTAATNYVAETIEDLSDRLSRVRQIVDKLQVRATVGGRAIYT